MVIPSENIDQLKAWLKSCLVGSYGWGSDCENLTKYVVALVKKVKSSDELKSHCTQNLHVFFNDNTEKFIKELCECLESKLYLQPYGVPDTSTSEKVDDVTFIVDKKPDPMLKERERSRSRSPRRRSRSPKRSRSPPSRRFRSRSRSRDRYNRRKRSRSPRRRRYSRSRSPSRRTPPRDLRDTLIRKHTGPAVPARQRCRDFDEQGFCIQGELCPYDHGSDPVILDSTVPPYNPIRGPVAPVVPEYNPMEPDMRHPPPSFNNWNYQPGPPPNGPLGPGPQRELLPIQRNITPVQRVALVPHQTENQKPRFQRGKELEVRKIPRHQNNIATLNEFFKKFGTVNNIQVNFQGCPESALVSFANYNEAVAAYRSPEAVLGNRFIRLFWHNATSGPNNNNNNSQHSNWNVNNNNNSSNNNSNNGIGGPHKHSAPRNDGGLNSKHISKEDGGPPPKKLAKPAPESLKKDNQAEKTKQFVNKKGNFIDQYIERQKRLKEQLEKCTTDEKREEIKQLLNEMDGILEKLKPKNAPGSVVPEIQTEKQLLDAELDIYTQLQQGTCADSKEITDKIIALRRRAKTLGLIDASNIWHGKMPHKGILLALQPKPKLQPAQLQLDKRTSVVAVSAGDLEMAGLCKHFSRLGKIVNVKEEGTGSDKVFVFSFASRRAAEVAMNRGGLFRGISLKWSWKEESENGPKIEVKPSEKASQEKQLASSLNVVDRPASEEQLLGEDEEQDDEEQSRSWRH